MYATQLGEVDGTLKDYSNLKLNPCRLFSNLKYKSQSYIKHLVLKKTILVINSLTVCITSIQIVTESLISKL